jgi:hypothetical protein
MCHHASYQCSDKVLPLSLRLHRQENGLGASWLAASWVALPQPTPCWRAEAMHHGPDSPLSFALTARGLAKSHFGQLFDPTLHATIPSSQHLFAVVQPHNPPHSPFGPSSKWLAIHPVATIAVVPKGQLHRGLCSLSGRLGKLHHRSRRLRYASAYAMHMLLILLNIYFVYLRSVLCSYKSCICLILFTCSLLTSLHFVGGSIWGFNQDPCAPPSPPVLEDIAATRYPPPQGPAHWLPLAAWTKTNDAPTRRWTSPGSMTKGCTEFNRRLLQ